LNAARPSATDELAAVFPKEEVANMLLETYFGQVHWFMLLFHQDDFRSTFAQVSADLHREGSDIALGTLSTAVAVCAISLQYVSYSDMPSLTSLEVDAEALKLEMFTALGHSLLDILALGSLDTVYTCVLMGTYYLYHGEPDLAWPLCGCALRTAQALSLHRRTLPDASLSGQPLHSFQRSAEARKRCWWAIYEIDTFCCMLYGLPLSITDSDCDVEHLDPSVQYVAGIDTTSSMLYYKPAMAKLTKITKSALSELYAREHKPGAADLSPDSYEHGQASIVRKVRSLDKQIQSWRDNLPPHLRKVFDHDAPTKLRQYGQPVSHGGASQAEYEATIIQLQALSLRLAYENARILLHRPLLSRRLKEATVDGGLSTGPSPAVESYQSSVSAARTAALATSNVASFPIFERACNTYAAAFIEVHLLTAGITLCILAGLEPLGADAHESKLGVQRIMQMQSRFRGCSVLADEGFDILERLLALTLEKELTALLPPHRMTSQAGRLVGTDKSGPSDLPPTGERTVRTASPRVSKQMHSQARYSVGVDTGLQEHGGSSHEQSGFDLNDSKWRSDATHTHFFIA
jgi:hypothetical protein